MPYICNCAGIKSSEFFTELRQGAQKTKDVYQGLGRKPQCGVCHKQMHKLIQIWQLHPNDEQIQSKAMFDQEFLEEKYAEALDQKAKAEKITEPRAAQKRRAIVRQYRP